MLESLPLSSGIAPGLVGAIVVNMLRGSRGMIIAGIDGRLPRPSAWKLRDGVPVAASLLLARLGVVFARIQAIRKPD